MTERSERPRQSLVESDVTEAVIGGFFDCYNQLGIGFLESVYEGGLEILLADAGLDVRRQEKISVWFRGREIGHFRADLIVNNRVLIEIKRAKRIHPRHKAQLINALKATRMEIGLLLNFGPRPQFKRVLLTNDRKPNLPPARSPIQPEPIRAV
jgi:GxxExxY protein